VVGVNPNGKLKLHIVKVFDAEGWAYSSTLASAAQKCRAAGANVISMSLGGSFKSKTEENTFNQLAAQGVLSIAAAGNAGNKTMSYPASYSIVMSVAAVDENKAKAAFSQENNQVEISAPGVGVLSTVPMGSGVESSLTVAGDAYAAGDMEGSGKGTVTAELFDFGLGSGINPAASGKTCLIARGSIDFATKVTNCHASGGVAAVIYNNVAGGFSGTLGTMQAAIPVVTVSQADGNTLKTQIASSATVSVKASNYAYFDGTSMATPHVSAVAALVWSYFPTCSASQIRSALNKTAEDLGARGRDAKYGYGLVRAKAAYDFLSRGCNG
jgi:subtilisin family serine protease